MGSVCGAIGRQLLPTPEIRGSNPGIVKLNFLSTVMLRKDENKEKRGPERPNLKSTSVIRFVLILERRSFDSKVIH